jgi:uncharacterized protein YecE (DUF72 family)
LGEAVVVKIGCCGFPVGREKYRLRLQVVEVQETFYQPPKPETARRWRLEAPPEFEFALKAWQLITHEASSPTYRRLRRALDPEERRLAGSFKDTSLVRQAWEVTRELARILAARVILFQCPASFGPSEENLVRLGRFFRQIERDEFLFAWEPRGGWPPELVAGLCRELDLIQALDPFSAAPYPGALAYFRLHGKGGYRYTYTDEDLVELKALVAGYQEVYVFFNNLSMWQDACRFVEIMGGKAGS